MFTIAILAGIVLIPPTVAILATRGHLPGTRRQQEEPRGFPIEPANSHMDDPTPPR